MQFYYQLAFLLAILSQTSAAPTEQALEERQSIAVYLTSSSPSCRPKNASLIALPRLESARAALRASPSRSTRSHINLSHLLYLRRLHIHILSSRDCASRSPNAIVAPAEGSEQATLAPSSEAADDAVDEAFDAHLEDNYNGIDWGRLKLYTKPITTHQHKRSWIYRHGYRVARLKDPTRVFFICHWCFKHKLTDIGIGIYNTSAAVSSAARHLSEQKPGHRLVAPGKTPVASVYNALTTASPYLTGSS
ncbi:hypothetical protein P3342_009113 [Pyrenophora teres f. teres]|nr:hypothetical protein P3342_009113 [Pyrenophora teres f. teres]